MASLCHFSVVSHPPIPGKYTGLQSLTVRSSAPRPLRSHRYPVCCPLLAPHSPSSLSRWKQNVIGCDCTCHQIGSQGKSWWEYAWTSQGKLEAVSETWPEMGGPSGAREASTVIDPDEDKWTGPIWPPCGGESSTGKGGFGMAGGLMDAQPNWWPAGLEVGWGGPSTDWVAWVSIYPEQGLEIKWSAGRALKG